MKDNQVICFTIESASFSVLCGEPSSQRRTQKRAPTRLDVECLDQVSVRAPGRVSKRKDSEGRWD
jgi:hypothetical protein